MLGQGEGVCSGLAVSLFPSSDWFKSILLSTSDGQKLNSRLSTFLCFSLLKQLWARLGGSKAPMAPPVWLHDYYFQREINEAIAEKIGEILSHLSLPKPLV